MSFVFFFLMIRRPPRSTLDRSSAASDVYKRQQPCSERDNGKHEHRPREEQRNRSRCIGRDIGAGNGNATRANASKQCRARGSILSTGNKRHRDGSVGGETTERRDEGSK